MNKAESDLRPPEVFAVATTATQAGLSGGFLGGPMWWYLALAALVLAACEWYLYQRRHGSGFAGCGGTADAL